MPNNLLVRWSQVVIACCLLGIVFFEYIRPMVTEWVYRNEFMRLSLECDQAMHNEVAIRNLSSEGLLPNSMVVSGAVELAVCHQYDKLRKRMLIWGVTEEQLALLGLRALEAERIPVGRMVEPHRMSRF